MLAKPVPCVTPPPLTDQELLTKSWTMEGSDHLRSIAASLDDYMSEASVQLPISKSEAKRGEDFFDVHPTLPRSAGFEGNHCVEGIN